MGVAEQHKNIGTTIKVRDLFFTLPVRRKNLVPSAELERIKQRIERIALVHPGISFTLYDNLKGTRVLQTRKVFYFYCRTVLLYILKLSFSYLFLSLILSISCLFSCYFLATIPFIRLY